MAAGAICDVTSDEDGMRLDRWFKSHYPALSYGRLQKLMRKGDVRLDGKRVKPNARIVSGQKIRVPPLGDFEKQLTSQKRQYMVDPKDEEIVKNMVIFKNNDVIAINKPYGLAVQGGTKTERHLDGMLDFLQFDAVERPRLVHRLDRDTSGIMLLARNRKSATKLGRAFKMHESRKIYWAIITGVPESTSGTIKLALSKAGGKGQEKMVGDEEFGKNAITEFEILERAGMDFSLVALWPRTGRTHQLRAHMAAIGCPILGDGKYGGKKATDFGGVGEKQSRKLHLYAREIDIPDGPRVKAPLPEHMRITFDLWGFDEREAEKIFVFENVK